MVGEHANTVLGSFDKGYHSLFPGIYSTNIGHNNRYNYPNPTDQ